MNYLLLSNPHFSIVFMRITWETVSCIGRILVYSVYRVSSWCMIQNEQNSFGICSYWTALACLFRSSKPLVLGSFIEFIRDLSQVEQSIISRICFWNLGQDVLHLQPIQISSIPPDCAKMTTNGSWSNLQDGSILGNIIHSVSSN